MQGVGISDLMHPLNPLSINPVSPYYAARVSEEANQPFRPEQVSYLQQPPKDSATLAREAADRAEFLHDLGIFIAIVAVLFAGALFLGTRRSEGQR